MQDYTKWHWTLATLVTKEKGKKKNNNMNKKKKRREIERERKGELRSDEANIDGHNNVGQRGCTHHSNMCFLLYVIGSIVLLRERTAKDTRKL